MTTKEIIEGVTAWVNENICSKIELKLPDDNTNDDGYTVKRVNPAAFPLFIPARDRIPPKIKAPIPSICVQLMEGADDLTNDKRTMKIRLCMATWNPGKNSGETLKPTENPEALGGYTYAPEPVTEDMYERNGDGWKDLYNLQDIALAELEGTEFFAGVRILQDEPITYGPFTEDGAIWDFYPYWHGWICFTITCGVSHKMPETYRNLLL